MSPTWPNPLVPVLLGTEVIPPLRCQQDGVTNGKRPKESLGILLEEGLGKQKNSKEIEKQMETLPF